MINRINRYVKEQPITRTPIPLLLGLFLFVSSAWAYLPGNGSHRGFCESTTYLSSPCDGDGAFTFGGRVDGELSAGSHIEELVMLGGAHFLKGQSLLLLLSNRVELSDLEGIDRTQWLGYLEESLQNISAAVDAYARLVTVADATPYNGAALNLLEKFDYNRFQGKFNLEPGIFKEVKQLLLKGNIRGFYKEFYISLVELKTILLGLREKYRVSADRIPGLADLWLANETSARMLIFSQYVTRVFFEIQ